MGQCKSKVTVLDDSDREGNDGGRGKRSKRKWRKSKAYSLSGSVDGELNCDNDNVSLSKLTKLQGSGGPVLVSYSLRKDEKIVNEDKIDGLNSCHMVGTSGNCSGIASNLVDVENIKRYDNVDDKREAPIAEPESDSSNNNSPVKGRYDNHEDEASSGLTRHTKVQEMLAKKIETSPEPGF